MGVPVRRFLVIRQEHVDLAEAGVEYNVIKHNPPVLSGAQAGAAPTFVNPNLDVVYSEAWIACRREHAYAAGGAAECRPGRTRRRRSSTSGPKSPTTSTRARCPSTRTARSRCAWPVLILRYLTARSGWTCPSAKAKLSLACRWAPTWTRRSRSSTGSPSARRGSAADRAGGPGTGVHEHRAAGGGDVRAAGARSGAGQHPTDRVHARCVPPAPGPDRSVRRRRPGERASGSTNWCAPRVYPAFMKLLLTDLAEVGRGWRTTGNRSGFADRLPVPHRRQLRRHLVEPASEVIYYALQAGRDGTSPDRRSHLRASGSGRRVTWSTSTGTGR